MSLHWHWGPWKIVSANETPNLKETNGIIDTDIKKHKHFFQMITVRKEIASFLTITDSSDWK